MAADGALGFPVIAVNEAQTKHLFDNRYGTGQSTLDGILRATNILIAGRKVVVAGYGWVGKGIASRMAGHGAHVAVVEVDPVRALEALMDGFQVMTARPRPPPGASCSSPRPATSTSSGASTSRRCATARSWPTRGHFDAELDLAALRALAEGHVREVRDNVQEFDLGGKKLNLIAEGRLVNLGAAEGHPAAVMDMSFANQALSAEYVAQHHAELEPRVYVVPEAIDAEVARLKLAALGIELEPMTPEQADVRRVLAARHLTAMTRAHRRAVRGVAIADPDRRRRRRRHRAGRAVDRRRRRVLARGPAGRGRPARARPRRAPTARRPT